MNEKERLEKKKKVLELKTDNYKRLYNHQIAGCYENGDASAMKTVTREKRIPYMFCWLLLF